MKIRICKNCEQTITKKIIGIRDFCCSLCQREYRRRAKREHMRGRRGQMRKGKRAGRQNVDTKNSLKTRVSDYLKEGFETFKVKLKLDKRKTTVHVYPREDTPYWFVKYANGAIQHQVHKDAIDLWLKKGKILQGGDSFC